MGHAVMVIPSASGELERNLIIERVRSGMRRAKLEGQHIGRPKLIVNREAVIRDRQQGTAFVRLQSCIGCRDPRYAVSWNRVRQEVLHD